MCGRYTLTTKKEDLVRHLGIPPDAIPDPLEPRYNIAPSQPVPALVLERGPRGNEREADARLRVATFRWGLVPAWAKDPAIGNRLINARSETVAEKPAFRDSFRRQRCLLLADGFYEWQARERGKPKVPHHIRLRTGEAFTFAGLWARWRSPEGDTVHSCTIITGEPNELVATVHDRMPVLVAAENRNAWMDPDHRNEAALLSILRPCDASLLEMIPVSRYVNDPDHEGAECLLPFRDEGADAPDPETAPTPEREDPGARQGRLFDDV